MLINSFIYKDTTKFNWEKYDDYCSRSNIKIPFNIVKKIYCLTNLPYPIKQNTNIYHYIKYNINKSYDLSPHNDGCKITIIIYLNKDQNIKENFYIENKLVKENYWSENNDTYGCLVMWSDDNEGANHYGKILGSGSREILCLFL